MRAPRMRRAPWLELLIALLECDHEARAAQDKVIVNIGDHAVIRVVVGDRAGERDVLGNRNRSADAGRDVGEAAATRVESIRVERHRDRETYGHRSERGARSDTDLAYDA